MKRAAAAAVLIGLPIVIIVGWVIALGLIAGWTEVLLGFGLAAVGIVVVGLLVGWAVDVFYDD